MFKVNRMVMENGILRIDYLIHNVPLSYYPHTGQYGNGELTPKNIKVEGLLERLKSQYITDKHVLISVVPSTSCKGKCPYCYAHEMKVSDVKCIDQISLTNRVQNLITDDTGVLQFYGGEPLLYPSIINDISFDKKIEVITGLLFSDEEFYTAISLLRDKKNVTFTISIDPPDNDGNYHTRLLPPLDGNKTFEMIKDRLAILKDYGFNFSIRSTLTRDGFRLDKMLNSIESKIGEVEYIFGVVHGFGNEKWNMTEQQRDFVDSFIESHISQVMLGRRKLIPGVVASLYNEYLTQLKNKNALVYNDKGICNFDGRGGITIDGDGDFCLCPETATKINKQIERKLVHNECLKCDYLMACGSLCTWNKPKENEAWCWLSKMSIKYAFPLAVVRASIEHHKELVRQKNDNGGL